MQRRLLQLEQENSQLQSQLNVKIKQRDEDFNKALRESEARMIAQNREIAEMLQKHNQEVKTNKTQTIEILKMLDESRDLFLEGQVQLNKQMFQLHAESLERRTEGQPSSSAVASMPTIVEPNADDDEEEDDDEDEEEETWTTDQWIEF